MAFLCKLCCALFAKKYKLKDNQKSNLTLIHFLLDIDNYYFDSHERKDLVDDKRYFFLHDRMLLKKETFGMVDERGICAQER